MVAAVPRPSVSVAARPLAVPDGPGAVVSPEEAARIGSAGLLSVVSGAPRPGAPRYAVAPAVRLRSERQRQEQEHQRVACRRVVVLQPAVPAEPAAGPFQVVVLRLLVALAAPDVLAPAGAGLAREMLVLALAVSLRRAAEQRADPFRRLGRQGPSTWRAPRPVSGRLGRPVAARTASAGFPWKVRREPPCPCRAPPGHRTRRAGSGCG